MQINKIDSPETYLSYFYNSISKYNCQEKYPLIYLFFQDLCQQFEYYYEDNTELFNKMAKLLAIDAQLQIIIECLPLHDGNEMIRNLGEDWFIKMVQKDKAYYYRELVGHNMNIQPPWGIIYLSEENE